MMFSKITFSTVFLFFSMMALVAKADPIEVTLDLGNHFINADKDGKWAYYLEQALKEKQPSLDPSQFLLKRIDVYAKGDEDGGSIFIYIKSQFSDSFIVKPNPAQFKSDDEKTYEVVSLPLTGDVASSDVQLVFDGTQKILKITLEGEAPAAKSPAVEPSPVEKNPVEKVPEEKTPAPKPPVEKSSPEDKKEPADGKKCLCEAPAKIPVPRSKPKDPVADVPPVAPTKPEAPEEPHASQEPQTPPPPPVPQKRPAREPVSREPVKKSKERPQQHPRTENFFVGQRVLTSDASWAVIVKVDLYDQTAVVKFDGWANLFPYSLRELYSPSGCLGPVCVGQHVILNDGMQGDVIAVNPDSGLWIVFNSRGDMAFYTPQQFQQLY